MNGTDLLHAGRAVLGDAHQLILPGSALGVLSILAGLLSRRVGAPVLVVFLVVVCSPGRTAGYTSRSTILPPLI